MRLRLDPKRPGKLRVYEHAIQAGLFAWAAMMENRVPEFKLLHAIPNGAATRRRLKTTPAGQIISYSPEGKKLRREGLKKGIPDVCWPVPRGGYAGLYIEHKAPDSKTAVSDEQWKMVDLLRAQGYCVAFSTNTQHSIEIIKTYYGLGITEMRCFPVVRELGQWFDTGWTIVDVTPHADPPRRIHRVNSKAGRRAAAR